MAIIIYLLCSIWFNTRYKIENNKLRITYVPFKRTIDIHDIKTIRNTTNPSTAPTLSIYRIEINYGKYDTICISTKDKQAFINELQNYNSKILIVH